MFSRAGHRVSEAQIAQLIVCRPGPQVAGPRSTVEAFPPHTSQSDEVRKQPLPRPFHHELAETQRIHRQVSKSRPAFRSVQPLPESRDASLQNGFPGVVTATSVQLYAPTFRLWQCRGVLALQLPFLKVSESMGNHDSKIVDAY